MYADERLKADILRRTVKEVIKPVQRKSLAQQAVEQFKISVSKACLIFHLVRPVIVIKIN